MMKIKIFSIFFIILIISLSVIPCSALTQSTYNDVAQNNSNVQNLLSYAMNYSNFAESDYVIYSPAQNTYFIVWGNFTLSGNKVTSDETVNIIEYSRNSQNQYQYISGTNPDFTLTVNNVVVSNVKGLGMSSQIYEEYSYHNTFVEFSIFFAVILFLILLFKIRKG